MKKHGIKAPRAPKGEDLKVTIAAQDKQIELLIKRCQSLQMMNDAMDRSSKLVAESRELERKTLDETCEALNARSLAYHRLLGWQDCAREMLTERQLLERFPSNAPGV